MRQPTWNRSWPRSASVFVVCLSVAISSRDHEGIAAEKRLPNFVIVLTDDQGYQDLGCFGSPDIQTPNLDRMASEGMRFTDFYVAQSTCSASRAALLTGCYSNRIGILGSLGPKATIGLNDSEKTIADVLKTVGYATALYGKWHLGHHTQFLPTRHGFDDFFGLPYSNDMWPFHPTAGDRFPDLPLIQGNKIVNPAITAEEQTHLTTWYTEHAVHFIESHKDEPFFVCVAHAMPHVPLFVSERFQGQSKRGLYGDAVHELDGSVGEILATLKRLQLTDRTLILFTSDNGPWLAYGNHAGCAAPLREGKGTTWEGGQRVPTVMWWPGKIPAGTECHEVAATIDILPTLAALAGADLPSVRIDGRNIWPLMSGQSGAKSPHEAYYFYWRRHLQAIRSGKWKLHFPHSYRSLKSQPGTGGQPGLYVQKRTTLVLFDLQNDPGETTNVANKHPDVVARIKRLARTVREDLGDSATLQTGQNVREPGRLP